MARKKTTRQLIRLSLQNKAIAHERTPDEGFDVLDVGTEYGHTGIAINEAFPFAFIVGVEVHKPTFDVCMEEAGTAYDQLHCREALEFLRGLKNFSFDVIVAAEILEHFDKPTGLLLLNELARCGKLVVMTTPLGFMPQKAKDGNPYQIHKSGWNEDELNALGWRTFETDKTHRLGVYYHRRGGRPLGEEE